MFALALVVKAVMPAGYMLSAGGERFLTVTVCSDASGTPGQMQIALPDKPGSDDEHSDAADKATQCAYSGLGHSALGGTDPVLLAAAFAFILLMGLAPPRTFPARIAAFLRPPLRGPPVTV
jgi:hypothetical protein